MESHVSVLPGSSPGPVLSQRRHKRNTRSKRRATRCLAAPTLLESLGDERMWRSLQPHFGTEAVRQVLQRVSTGQGVPAGLAKSLQAAVDQTKVLLSSVSAPGLPNLDAVALQQTLAAASAELAAELAALQPTLDLGAARREPHFGVQAAQQILGAAGKAWGKVAGASPVLKPLQDALSSATATVEAAASSTSHLVGDTAGALIHPVVDVGALLSQRASAAASSAVNAEKLLALVKDAYLQAEATGLGGYNLQTVSLLAGGIVAVALISGLRVNQDKPDDTYSASPATALLVDGLPWNYDFCSVDEYWSRRPVAVARRSIVVLGTAAGVGLGLLRDLLSGGFQRNELRRAEQVRRAIEYLGPAYVKVAQAISTRVDILSPAYLLEIQRLQDRVPPFATSVAKEEMVAAWGQEVESVLAEISPEPIAAASLGQVYRGVLQDGQEVAVKVQRPRLRERVALDLLLMRKAAALFQSNTSARTDWVGLIDEWAGRFFQELDYKREAANATIFERQMASLGGITTPTPYPALTTHTVLTTAWVQGEKLQDSTADDVRQLCSTLLNCYLIQLLETGFLHADPHPGNLLRTREGKICILDFGLMTEVTPEQSITLVEYIAHLSVADWEGVTRDLVALGFVPPGAPDPVEAGLVAPLGRILSALSTGGGAAKINIDDVIEQLNALSRNYPFQVPPYFALILRAFSVIEGIALRVDPDYSIVAECFPYVSRRLVTDNHPRTRAALHQLLYANKTRIDVARLRRLTTGFGAFTTQGLTATNPSPNPSMRAAPAGLPEPAKEALKAIFSSEGTYAQEVVVEEAVAAVDALQRSLFHMLSTAILASPLTRSMEAATQALGPLRPLLLPLPTPLEVLHRIAPVAVPTEEDREALASATEILALLSETNNTAGAPRGNQLGDALRQVTPLLPELLPGLSHTGELFLRSLVRRQAVRLAESTSSWGRSTAQQRYDADVAYRVENSWQQWEQGQLAKRSVRGVGDLAGASPFLGTERGVEGEERPLGGVVGGVPSGSRGLVGDLSGPPEGPFV